MICDPPSITYEYTPSDPETRPKAVPWMPPQAGSVKNNPLEVIARLVGWQVPVQRHVASSWIELLGVAKSGNIQTPPPLVPHGGVQATNRARVSTSNTMPLGLGTEAMVVTLPVSAATLRMQLLPVSETMRSKFKPTGGVAERVRGIATIPCEPEERKTGKPELRVSMLVVLCCALIAAG